MGQTTYSQGTYVHRAHNGSLGGRCRRNGSLWSSPDGDALFVFCLGPRGRKISRADANKRRLLNEDEVLRRIEHFGFRHVMPGRLPVADQIALFSGAQIVAGPHGAGLTNLVFMPEGGAVVENFHPGWVQGAYAWLSHLAGQTYGHVVADKPATDLDYRLSGVGLDAFEREVEAALERVAATRGLAGASVSGGVRSPLGAKGNWNE